MLSDANDGSSGESFVTKTVHSPLRQPDPSHHVTTERTDIRLQTLRNSILYLEDLQDEIRLNEGKNCYGYPEYTITKNVGPVAYSCME